MTHVICKLIGHREFDDEVLDIRPWEDRDFSGYSKEDFRSETCLRCGDELARLAA
ncbi:MAG: hypothetical protein M0Z33_00275 [Actinomycetota bacterium]|nr:hypothetical protein [Actinomycetota bacterium]